MAKDLEFFKTLLNGLTHKIDSDRTWDKLKDKPFYEETKTVNEPLSVTWDGNTEGLIRIPEAPFFKVSDVVLTDDQIKTSVISMDGMSLSLGDIWEYAESDGYISEDLVFLEIVIFCRKANALFGELPVPETGIYFMDELAGVTLTTAEPIEHIKTVTKKIDPKYLPDNIGGGGVKYVNILEEYDDVNGEWIRTADTPYAEIRGWIDSGMDVKCIYGSCVYNLCHVYPDPATIQHGVMMAKVGFSYSDDIDFRYIDIHEDNYVDCSSCELAGVSQLSTVAWSGNYNDLNDRIVGDNVAEYRTTVLPLQLSTRNQLPEGVVFENESYTVDVSYKWYSNNQQVVQEGITLSRITSTTQGVKSYTCGSGISLHVHDDNTAEANPGSMQIKDLVFTIYGLKTIVPVKQLDEKYLPSAIARKSDVQTDVQTIIEEQVLPNQMSYKCVKPTRFAQSSTSAQVVYGADKFVVIPGISGSGAAYSYDGIKWYDGSLTGQGYSNPIYGNNKFVAYDSSGGVAYSYDGIVWNETVMKKNGSNATSFGYNSVAYGNGKYVAVGDSNAAAYSTDGINWTTSSISFKPTNWEYVFYGNSMFIAMPYSGAMYALYSADGISWNTANLPGTLTICGYGAYGNGKFVMFDKSGNRGVYSEDGINWYAMQVAGAPFNNGWTNVVYGGGKFIATDNNVDSNTAAYSEDGINWTMTTMPEMNSPDAVAYGGELFVAVCTSKATDTNVVCSTDGIEWGSGEYKFMQGEEVIPVALKSDVQAMINESLGVIENGTY